MLGARTKTSVMVHSCVFPQEGDFILFNAEGGYVVRAEIISVEPCGDPEDMFTLEYEIVERCLPT